MEDVGTVSTSRLKRELRPEWVRIGRGAGRSRTQAPAAPLRRARGRRRRRGSSADGERRPHRQQPGESKDVLVAHPDAPVRNAAGKEVRPVRSMDPDEASGGPVGQHFRARARAEGDRPVERAARSSPACCGCRTRRAASATAGEPTPIAGAEDPRGRLDRASPSVVRDRRRGASAPRTAVRAPNEAPTRSCCSAGREAAHASTPGPARRWHDPT